MARLIPYLSFTGNCREAMTFYQECLGGQLWMQTFAEAPMAENLPAEMREQILHAALNSDALVLMASDSMQGPAPTPGGPVTLCINTDEADELKTLFGKLSSGGAVTQPMSEAFFGWYGALTDRYGINWMFQSGGQPNA